MYLFDLSILQIFFEWTVMSCSSCDIRETIDVLVLRSFSISFNLLSPMDRYMRLAKAIVLDYRCIYGFGKSYQHGLWHIYAFVNFFDHKRSIIIIIFICIRWIFVYSVATIINNRGHSVPVSLFLAKSRDLSFVIHK